MFAKLKQKTIEEKSPIPTREAQGRSTSETASVATATPPHEGKLPAPQPYSPSQENTDGNQTEDSQQAKPVATNTHAQDTPTADHVTSQSPTPSSTDIMKTQTANSVQKVTSIGDNGVAGKVGLVEKHDSKNLNSNALEGVSEVEAPSSGGQWGSMFGRLRKRVGETASSIQQKPADSSEKQEKSATPSRPHPSIGKEEELTTVESLPREQLLAMLSKQRQAALRYKGRFTELMEAYKTLEKQLTEQQTLATDTEKKLQRKLSEMREAQELDRQAKAHMEETFRLSLEEKDEKITVMQTQVRLLKERLMPQSPTPEKKDKEQEAQALQSQVSSLEGYLAKYKEGLRLARQKVVELQKEKETLEEELAKVAGKANKDTSAGEGAPSVTSTELQALKDEINRIRTENDALRSTGKEGVNRSDSELIQAKEQEIEKLVEALQSQQEKVGQSSAHHQEEIDSLRSQNQELRDAIAETEKDSSTWKERFTQKEKEKKCLDDQVTELKEELAKKDTMVTETSQQLVEAQKLHQEELQNLQVSKERLLGEFRTASQKVGELEGERTKFARSLQALKKKQTALASERDAAVAEKENLHKEVESLKKKTSLVDEEKHQLSESIQVLQSKMAMVEAELQKKYEVLQAELVQANNEREQETQELGQKLQAMEDEKERLSQSLQAMGERLSFVSAEKEAIVSEKESWSENTGSLTSQLALVIQERDDLTTAVHSLESKLATTEAGLQKNCDDLQARLVETNTEKARETQALHQDLEVAENEKTRLSLSLQAFEEKFDSLFAEKEALTAQNSHLLENIESFKSQLASVTIERDKQTSSVQNLLSQAAAGNEERQKLLVDLESQLAESNKERESLSSMLGAKDKEWERKMTEMEVKHSAQLETLANSHKQNLEVLETHHHQQLEESAKELADAHAKEKVAITQEHEDIIQQLQVSLQEKDTLFQEAIHEKEAIEFRTREESENRLREHQQIIDKIKETHAAELLAEREQSEKRFAALKEKSAKLIQKLKSEGKTAEEETKKKFEMQLQEIEAEHAERCRMLEAKLSETEAGKEQLAVELEQFQRMHDSMQASHKAELGALTSGKDQELHKITSNLRQELKICQTDLSQLRVEHSSLQSKHQTIASELHTLASEHQNLTSKHQTLTSEYQTFTSEHQTLSSEYEVLTTEHKSLVNEHQTLVHEHQTLVHEHQTLSTGHHALTTEHQTLVSKHKELATKQQDLIERHKLELVALTEKLNTECSHTVQMLEEKHNQELASLCKSISELSVSKEQLLKEMVGAKSSLEDQKKQLAESSETHKNELRLLKEKHDKLLEDFSILQTECGQHQESVKVLESTLKQAQTDHRTLLKKTEAEHLSELQKLESTHKQQLQQMSTCLDDEKQKSLKLGEQNSSMVRSLQLQLEDTTGKLGEKALEIDHLKQELKEMTQLSRESGEQASQLQSSLLASESDRKQCVEELQLHHSTEIQSQKEEIAKLTSQFKAEQKRLQEDCSKSVKALQSQIDEQVLQSQQLKQSCQEQLKQMKEDNETAIQALQKQHQTELLTTKESTQKQVTDTLRKKFTEKLAQSRSKHEAAIAKKGEELAELASSLQEEREAKVKVESESSRKLGEMQEKYEARVKEIQSQMEQEIVALRSQYESQLSSLAKEHSTAVATAEELNREQLQKAEASLQDKISGLQAELQKKTTYASQLKEATKTLRQANSKLTSELEESKELHQSLARQLQESGGQLSHHEEQANHLEQLLLKEKERATELESNFEALKREMAASQAKRSSEVEAAREEVKKRAEGKLVQIKKQLNDQLEQTIASHRATIAQMTSEKEALELTLQAAKKENTIYQSKAESAERRLAQSQAGSADQEARYQSKLNLLNTSVSEKEEALASVEKENRELRSQLELLSGRSQQLEGELAKLQSRLSSLAEQQAKENQSLSVELSTMQSTNQQLETQLSTVREQHSLEEKSLLEQVEQAERNTQKMEEECRKKMDELIALTEGEKERMKTELLQQSVSFTASESAVRSELAEAQLKCKQLQGKLQALELEKDEELQRHTTDVSQLEAELMKNREEKQRDLERVKTESETRVASVEADWQKKLRDREAGLEQQLMEAQQQLQQKHSKESLKAQQELAAMKQTINTVRAEGQQARDSLLTEEERVRRMEEQLVELQHAHEVEMDAVRREAEQVAQGRVREEVESARELLRQEHQVTLHSLQQQHHAEVHNLQQTLEEYSSQHSNTTRLETIVKDCKQALKSSEAEKEKLQQQLKTMQGYGFRSIDSPAHLSFTSTSTRSFSPSTIPDTPSRNITLDEEPHGAEFEYFQNVLFQYMMGKQPKQLVKVIAALARFSEKQKKDLYSSLL